MLNKEWHKFEQYDETVSSDRLSQLYLLREIVSANPLKQKKKVIKSDLKVLFRVYRNECRVRSGKWSNVSPSIASLANWCGIHERQTQYVTNSLRFSAFVKKINRIRKTSIYKIKDWVFDWFDAMSKAGILYRIEEDFDSAIDNIIKFLKSIETHVAHSQFNEKVINIVNSYRQKMRFKMHPSQPLKCTLPLSNTSQLEENVCRASEFEQKNAKETMRAAFS